MEGRAEKAFLSWQKNHFCLDAGPSGHVLVALLLSPYPPMANPFWTLEKSFSELFLSVVMSFQRKNFLFSTYFLTILFHTAVLASCWGKCCLETDVLPTYCTHCLYPATFHCIPFHSGIMSSPLSYLALVSKPFVLFSFLLSHSKMLWFQSESKDEVPYMYKIMFHCLIKAQKFMYVRECASQTKIKSIH